MAQQHNRITSAGGRLVGISVDSVGQNAAMVEKLGLPFPLLSDPAGEQAIKPYDVWDAEASIAKPAVVVVAPDRSVAFRQVGADFADRATEQDLVCDLRRLGFPPTSQGRPTPGNPQPGRRAVDLGWLSAYFRGAKFAVAAVRRRVPEANETADVLRDEYDRYLEALNARK